MSEQTDKIEFVRNYSDLSTDTGFQFEFHCDRCGAGTRTRFKPSVTGRITQIMDAANSLFGGLFSSAADMSERVRSAAWEKAHDDAFVEAVNELKPDFVQCPRCSGWVCRKSCWNERRGLCKECAPDLGVEMSAAQSSKAVQQAWEGASVSDEDQATLASPKGETVRASCPQCEAPLAKNAKFCPECGAKLQVKAFCSQCGAQMAPEDKFCPECGTRARQ